MTEFRVWAPRAERVELDLAGERTPMEQEAGGWWALEAPGADHGTDYAFRLDGGPPRPDPRSAWQPQGVHGPSRVLDHGRFTWTDRFWQPRPLSAALLYEAHVGTFSPEGTFEGVASRIDYLVDLGVTHLELLPVAEFAGERNWGYDGVNLYAPHHTYGGPEGLKRLVDTCHARGLAVILDVVYNHFGPEGAYWSDFAPYLSEQHGTSWGSGVNVDGPGSDEVRRFLIDNALMWLRDYHLDGLRLDAVHSIHDTSALHFLEQLATEVATLEGHVGRHMVLIAESNRNDPREVTPREAGGYGLDAQWSDDLHHTIHALLTGERAGYIQDYGEMEDLTKVYREAYVFDGRYSAGRQQSYGRPARGLPGSRFVVFSQNHDQVGNRPWGERLGHLVGADKARLAAALVLFAPYVPMLFQGEEWLAGAPFLFFTDYGDAGLREPTIEGRRKQSEEFGWGSEVPDPQAEETFRRSVLDWAEQEREPHAGALAWYRSLIRLRCAYPELTDGDREAVRARDGGAARWFTASRGRLTLACNLAEEPQVVPLGEGRSSEILLASGEVQVGHGAVTLGPAGVAILGPRN